MTDASNSPDPNGDGGAEPEGRSSYSTPRWVKIAGIIALILVLVVALALITGVAGPHGPRRHNPAGAVPGFYTPLYGVLDHGMQQL